MEKYPLVKEFLGLTCSNDARMSQLEKELKKRRELDAEEQLIEPRLDQELFELMVIEQCASQVKDNDVQMTKANTITQDCMFQILQIEDLLEMASVQDILYHTVHRKEQEVLRQMKLDDDSAEQEDEQNSILESRSIVQEFREAQASEKEAENELASVEKELDQSDREWTLTQRIMTDNRNRKIVSILQMSKLINELEEQLKEINSIKTDATEGHIDIHEDHQPKIASPPDTTSPLQSASEFLNNFLCAYITTEDNEVRTSVKSKKDKTKKLSTPLRSILVNRKDDEHVANSNSPTKQDWLSFSGETEEDDEEGEITEEDSEEVSEEESAELSGDELEEASEEELDDEMELEDEEYEEEVKIEKSEMVLEPEEGEYDEKSGSEMEESLSDDKESGGEASGEEESDDGGKQVKSDEVPKADEEKSNKISDKPEILRVDILSPIRDISSWISDDIPTTSTGTVNRFTASQLRNYGINFDEKEAPPNKRLKLEEDEFPMAQPMPDFYKQPSSTYNNFDDQSLQFNSPHTNFDDEFLLSFSDDNDATHAGSSFKL
ncbi:eukaryotic translation initiation factor 5B isoform X2 [Drosophila teissieri]|uniref:eukaryotic translation initiation factor 5B isoform X2 n=1 Tax=Drosophila teissieri TaxID=7243 RepID=UPI001CBA5303|nr:eukaryotic translation initiation factor 5B isoform X2 [Drosophila teissieri]